MKTKDARELIKGVTYHEELIPGIIYIEDENELSSRCLHNEKITDFMSKRMDEKKLIPGIIYEDKPEESELQPGIRCNTEAEGAEISSIEIPTVFKQEDEHTEKAVVELARGIIYEDEPEAVTKSSDAVSQAVPSQDILKIVPQDILTQFLTYFSEGNMEEKIKILAKMRDEKKNALSISKIETEQMATLNFTLRLLKRIFNVFDLEYGQESMELSYLIEVEVFKMDGSSRIFVASVKADMVKSFSWIRRATESLAHIPRSKEEKEAWDVLIQRCIETSNVQDEVVYPNSGWRNYNNRGWRYVHATGAIGDESGLMHTMGEQYKLDVDYSKVGDPDVFRNAMNMTKICPKCSTDLWLFLYTHSCCLETLFKEAGEPLKFVFAIVGVTNSRKTSLALALAKVFNRKNFVADAEFATATACGIEKTLGTYKDSPILIDDFKPGVSHGEQIRMNQKLDELVRFYGNKVPKKRMNDYGSEAEKKYFPINAGCVITMEFVEGVQSTLTRMFVSEITTDDIDNNRLRYFQENRQILPTHLYDFLLWVTCEFDRVVAYIAVKFNDLCSRYKFAEPRYAEMFAFYMLTSEILMTYAVQRKFIVDFEKTGFLEMVEKLLVSELYTMGERLKKRDKAIFAIEALSEALKTGICSPLNLSPENVNRRCDIYQNEEFIFIKTAELLRIVREYSRRTGISVYIANEDELIGLLERVKVLDMLISDNGRRERSRKLPK